MSRPHDGHRPFLNFDNPLRKILPGGSHIPTKFLELLKNFEDSLARRLQKLKPKDKSDILSISWMILAIGSLCETHTEIKSLITNLEFPASEWNESWMDSYLKDSVKLLDICNSLSAEVSRLDQGQILLQYALHLLDFSAGNVPQDKLSKARNSILDWMQQVGSKGSSSCSPKSAKLDDCLHTLRGLAHTLLEPKVKTTARGRVLLRAMYGVKVQTIFVCSTFVAAFSRSAKALIELEGPEKFAWSRAFEDIQMEVNAELRRFGDGLFTVLKDLEAVDNSAVELLGTSQGSSDSDVEILKIGVKSLKEKVDGLSQGLDLLSKQIHGFFQIVLCGRDALLCNLRISCGKLGE